MAHRLAAYILLAAGLLISSCSQPQQHSCFRNVDSPDGWKAEDSIKLHLDLKSTGKPFTLNISALALEDIIGMNMGLQLAFISPDEDVYRDTITLNFEQTNGVVLKKKGGSIQIMWPYLQIDSINKDGRWNIILKRDGKENPAYSKILGIGASVTM